MYGVVDVTRLVFFADVIIRKYHVAKYNRRTYSNPYAAFFFTRSQTTSLRFSSRMLLKSDRTYPLICKA